MSKGGVGGRDGVDGKLEVEREDGVGWAVATGLYMRGSGHRSKIGVRRFVSGVQRNEDPARIWRLGLALFV